MYNIWKWLNFLNLFFSDFLGAIASSVSFLFDKQGHTVRSRKALTNKETDNQTHGRTDDKRNKKTEGLTDKNREKKYLYEDDIQCENYTDSWVSEWTRKLRTNKYIEELLSWKRKTRESWSFDNVLMQNV